MLMTRSHAITAAVASAAAMTATGITYAAAAPARQAQTVPAVVWQAPAPAQAPFGGDTGDKNAGRDDEGGDHDHGGRHRDYDDGWIQINERSYSAHPGGCITVVSGLGSTSLNIRNDSRKTIEVFRGITCDNGAPIATVGPYSSSNGVTPRPTRDVFVRHGVVGSFRVVEDHYGDRGDYY